MARGTSSKKRSQAPVTGWLWGTAQHRICPVHPTRSFATSVQFNSVFPRWHRPDATIPFLFCPASSEWDSGSRNALSSTTPLVLCGVGNFDYVIATFCRSTGRTKTIQLARPRACCCLVEFIHFRVHPCFALGVPIRNTHYGAARGLICGLRRTFGPTRKARGPWLLSLGFKSPTHCLSPSASLRT
jgi:hypothetical protein